MTRASRPISKTWCQSSWNGSLQRGSKATKKNWQSWRLWISGDLQAMLKESGSGVRDSKVSAENLAELIKMIHKNEISTTAAKKILEVMFTTGGDPSHIAEDEGLGQVSDEGAIAAAVDKVISENEKVVADYRSGKKQALGFLVGKVMAEMKGKANPKIASKLLADKLG